MKNALEYINQNKDRFINELIDLLKIPSISADSNYKDSMIKTAEAVKKNLLEAGCDSAEICYTPLPIWSIFAGSRSIFLTLRPRVYIFMYTVSFCYVGRQIPGVKEKSLAGTTAHESSRNAIIWHSEFRF